ncbi:TonB-dependent receptor [soil metagenome]
MKAFLCVTASLAAMAIGTAATAQDQSAPLLEDIVVTAQKRAENVQDVPIAVTAITSETLQKSRALDTRTLQLSVPALSYGTSSGFAMPFLRGIGSSVQTPGTEPSVATFVDGVYVAANQGVLLSLLGVDRVEVLAGPQGTLYGRNASGGAINLYTLTPSQTVDAKATTTYGNYARLEASGYISGPITDRLSVGLYAAASRRDTYLDYDASPMGQSELNKSWGARLKAVWEPVDGVKFTGSVERLVQQNVDAANRNVQPDALGITLGGDPTIKNYTVVSDSVQYIKPKTTAAVLRTEIDLGFGDLVGVTSYRKLRSDVQSSIDGVDIPLAYVAAPIRSKQFSQEAQILSKPSSPIKWIAGLFYLHEKGGYDPLYVRSGILFAGAPFNSSDTFGSYDTKSYAAFAQVTVPLTESFSITTGGRYTEDHKRKLPTVTALTLDGVSIGIPDTVFPGSKKSWSKFTPKVTLEYKIPDALFYATYSKGFKSGQFNVSQPLESAPVNPESLTDYEVGIKTELFDRRVRMNLAAYYYDFTGLQVMVLDPSGGVSAVLRNAANARAYGAEANITAAVTRNFVVNFSAAYEDSKYKRFDNAPFFIFSPAGNSQILGVSAAGNDLIRAPKFVGTAGATYTVPLASGAKIDLHGDAYYNDGFFWDPSQQFRQSSYTLLNASVTYTAPSGRWYAQVWGTNLTNRHNFIDIAATAPFGTYASDDAPRMYGVTLNWRM